MLASLSQDMVDVRAVCGVSEEGYLSVAGENFRGLGLDVKGCGKSRLSLSLSRDMTFTCKCNSTISAWPELAFRRFLAR
jgi:hypothetical protein